MPLFKRRKPDDEPEQKMDKPSSEQTQEPGAPSPTLDTGLGVPPRPPAPAAPVLFKDPAMGRSPFASPVVSANPPPSGNPPMPPSAPPRPPGPPALRGGPGREGPIVGPERRTLVVGRGISVQGMVQDAERLVVEGTVEASMIHATELSVSPGGVFRGEVEVEDAEVAGTVDGTLTVRGSLVVRATGTVLGTARCRRLTVEDGGQITGRIEMLTDQARSSEPARPSSGTPAAPSPVLTYES